MKGNSIIYPEIFGSNTELKYTPLLSGIKEDIIISEYTSNASYSFKIETDGLSLYSNGTNYYLGNEDDEKAILDFGELIVYDKIGTPGTGTMSVETTKPGYEYIITMTVDSDFLNDPLTVYPVTIDPTLTISDSTHGLGAIQDATIYEGYPNNVYGTNYYNRTGTPSEEYGIGRTVVKLSGFLASNEYKAINANQITSVVFHAKESCGGSTQFINLYPLTTNIEWTERTVTWNNIGNYSTALNCGKSVSGASWASFDITSLVKGWKNGTYPENAGFILISSNEAADKGFCSSEYTSAYRPYVVMEYDNKVSLNSGELVLQEGTSTTITATTSTEDLNVSWASSDTRIATVDNYGTVTAVRAGTTYISASVTVDGIMYKAYSKVNVLLPNGTYFIKNKQNSRYARVEGTTLANNGAVCQWEFDGSDMQRWIFTHVGSGYYTIQSSATSGTYYLGVKGDSPAVDTSVVLCTGTVTDGMKWKLEITTSGAYKIIPKITESIDYVLATSASNTTNGKRLLQGDYVANTSYRDEWFIMMLPTNGYEITYEPDAWNGSAIRVNSNCYNYALDKKNNVQNGQFYCMQPGENCSPDPQTYVTIELNGTYYGYPTYYYDMSDYEALVSCVEGDSKALQFTFQEIDRYAVCPEGTYKVALVMDVVDNSNITNYYSNAGSYYIEIPDMDFHWYRQNPDGTWSHKRGQTEVINFDDSGKIIYDPQLCDRNYEFNANGGTINYSLFVGYFAVTPLG